MPDTINVGGGGAYGLTAVESGTIPTGVAGELLSVNVDSAPAGSYVRLTLLSTTGGTSQTGITVERDGYTLFSEDELGSASPDDNSDFFISQIYAKDLLVDIRRGIREVKGKSITISKNAGNTAQDIQYAYEIWSPLT